MENQNVTEISKRAYRVNEVAQVTGTSIAFVRKQIAEKKLVARKLGQAVVILAADLDTWLTSAAQK